ncbi:MAG: putative bifunctional diguanylate cyclase/phosphodiesterase [Dehalococcoidia bacterium]
MKNALDRSMNATTTKRISLQDDLHHALEREEFELYYQPQVIVRTGEVVGAEALIRWQHPSRGIIFPSDFIKLAEESDLIRSLDEWVVRTACAQNKTWQNSGLAPLTVTVNLSAQQLATDGLADWIASALADSELDPGQLEVEITEMAAMRDALRSVAVLTDLRTLGVRIAIDDFGTGYSSLSYLAKLPITTLKIDRSFVSDLDAEEHSRSLVSAIIALAHGLGFDVLAEGVETEAQLALLRAYGCDRYQGFLFSKPWPVGAFEEIFRRRPSASAPVRSNPETREGQPIS